MPYTGVKSTVIFLKLALVQHTVICLFEDNVFKIVALGTNLMNL